MSSKERICININDICLGVACYLTLGTVLAEACDAGDQIIASGVNPAGNEQGDLMEMGDGVKLVVNADDFGLNRGCTAAIAECLRSGLVTDTTMVANGEAFDMAAQLAVSEFDGRVGIHFNLTEGVPLTQKILAVPGLCADGRFHGRIDRMRPLGKEERRAVYEELTAQCRRMLRAGVRITHADSHHHIHTGVFFAPIVARVCRDSGITRMRLHRNLGRISPAKRLVKWLYNLWVRRQFATTDYMCSADDIDLQAHAPRGVVEVMVHPDTDTQGRIIDHRCGISPLMADLRYWPEARRISYLSI